MITISLRKRMQSRIGIVSISSCKSDNGANQAGERIMAKEVVAHLIAIGVASLIAWLSPVLVTILISLLIPGIDYKLLIVPVLGASLLTTVLTVVILKY